jgi:hypothetical protein
LSEADKQSQPRLLTEVNTLPHSGLLNSSSGRVEPK